MIKQHNYFVKKQVKVEFSVTEHASFASGELATGSYGLGVYIPDNAIITNCFYDVLTTFVDADDDSATIALTANSAGDLRPLLLSLLLVTFGMQVCTDVFLVTGL